MYKASQKKLEKDYVEKLKRILRNRIYNGLEDDVVRDEADECLIAFLKEHGYDNIANAFEEIIFS